MGDDVPVVGKDHVARLAEERGGVGGEEVLLVPEAYDERCLAPGAHQQVWVVVVDHDEREVALELLVGLDDGVGEIALVVGLDQVRNRLGVSIGAECVTLRLEPLLELAVILHDPVEHDGQLALLARRQRVGVALGDGTVRRPAGVAETGRRARAVRRRCLLQELEVADGADVLEAVVLEERDARGVVTAVLEALKTLDEERLGCSRPDVSDDSAHPVPPSLAGAAFRFPLENAQEPGFRVTPSSRSTSRALDEREPRS